jgi:uncharacterized protein (TIGR02996 family)
MRDDDFLQTIGEAPDDDAPRLVYADWLDDHGQPDRAEFIRTQCRLAAMDESDPERPALAARERELLDRHAVEWAEPLRGLIDGWDYRRGFIDFVRLGWDMTAVGEVLAEVVRLVPLEALEVQDFTAGLLPAMLGVSERIAHLRDLRVGYLSEFTAEDVSDFLTSPVLSSVRHLDVAVWEEVAFYADALEALGWSPALSNVEALWLSVGGCLSHDLPEVVVRSLATSPYLRLRRLHLDGGWFEGPLMRDLIRGPAAGSVEALGFGDCSIDGDALDELVAPDVLANLRRLYIHYHDNSVFYKDDLTARFGPRVRFHWPDADTFPRRLGRFHWP